MKYVDFEHQFLSNPIKDFREVFKLGEASPNPFAKLSHAPGVDVG